MKQTLIKINNLLSLGIIEKYAIAGGMAQFYYIEPSVTYDLDLIVHVPGVENSINPLAGIYDWAKTNLYQISSEHIIIEGIPVQFLLAYNNLVSEALDKADEITIFDENTYILQQEYLMAIMLQTGRATDKERFARFLVEAEYDRNKFFEIIERFHLVEPYNKLVEKKNG